MTVLLDFEPVSDEVTRVVAGVSDDRLTAPTPCDHYEVTALLDHLMALTVAFRLAASKAASSTDGMAELAKESVPGESVADHLQADWQEQLPGRLSALAAAWRADDAWEGQTEVAGLSLPAELTGKVGLAELVLHGWDLARATGQPFDIDAVSAQAVLDFTSMLAQPDQAAFRNAIFAPIVEVSPDASVLDRALGLSGRDPAWVPLDFKASDNREAARSSAL